MIFATEPTGRIDTTITTVAVHGNDGHSQPHAAARWVLREFPEAKVQNILAVWRSGERDSAGYPVFNVEWVTEDAEVDRLVGEALALVKDGRSLAGAILDVTATEDETQGFTCPQCGRTSYHPQDKLHGWCGACNAFTGTPS